MLCLGRSQGQNPRSRRPEGFGRGTSRGTTFTMIDTSKAFSYNVVIIASRTRNKGFHSGWVWPMDSLGSPSDIVPQGDSEYWYS